jgi:hypothetical protein
MATLRREGNELVVKLTTLEKLAAVVRDDVRVPWSSVRYVRVNESPFRELRGLRLGSRLPGVALGTWYTRGGRMFAAVYRRTRGVVVELDGTRYRKLVVSLPDASEVAAALSRDLGL